MRFITVTRSNDCNNRTFVQPACKHCYLKQLLGFCYSAIQGALLFLIIERLTVCISLASSNSPTVEEPYVFSDIILSEFPPGRQTMQK